MGVAGEQGQAGGGQAGGVVYIHPGAGYPHIAPARLLHTLTFVCAVGLAVLPPSSGTVGSRQCPTRPAAPAVRDWRRADVGDVPAAAHGGGPDITAGGRACCVTHYPMPTYAGLPGFVTVPAAIAPRPTPLFTI